MHAQSVCVWLTCDAVFSFALPKQLKRLLVLFHSFSRYPLLQSLSLLRHRPPPLEAPVFQLVVVVLCVLVAARGPQDKLTSKVAVVEPDVTEHDIACRVLGYTVVVADDGACVIWSMVIDWRAWFVMIPALLRVASEDRKTADRHEKQHNDDRLRRLLTRTA